MSRFADPAPPVCVLTDGVGFDPPADSTADRFRSAYDAHFSVILRYALRRVGEPGDAADVVSETFLTAWRRFDETPPGDIRPWLFAIARHVLHNHHRAMRRRVRLGAKLREVLTQEVVPDPAGGVVERDRVHRALRRLGADDRELLTLTAWDGLSPSEAAEALGIPAGTARMRLSRARKRFTSHLDGDPPGDAQPGPGHVQETDTDDAAEEDR